MDLPEQLAAHKEVIGLWERYRELQKQLFVHQSAVAELANDICDCGKKIYELYKSSDDGLNGQAKP